MARTYKKAYTKSKAFDRSCRNHGSCPWCVQNRTIQRVKIKEILADPELKAELIAGVVNFCCKLEGHDHE